MRSTPEVMYINREKKCQDASFDAWAKAKNVQDRIKRLQKVVVAYPENMTPLSGIASSYLELDDVDNAVKTYQKIIDLKDTFDFIWDNELGKAYLFTNEFEKAMKNLKEFEKRGHDTSNGLFIALAYLKKGDRKKFTEQFNKWISKEIEESFHHNYYKKYINALFSKKEAKFIEEAWNEYYNKHIRMEPYQLYCKLYKQHYLRSELDKEGPDEHDVKIPAKLSRSQFEELKREYLSLDRKVMFGDPNDTEYERWFELKELLFAYVIFD